jgi:hypothetical protein
MFNAGVPYVCTWVSSLDDMTQRGQNMCSDLGALGSNHGRNKHMVYTELKGFAHKLSVIFVNNTYIHGNM